MIQRIQSVYLFIVIIILGSMFFFPIAGYYGELSTYKFTLIGIKNMVPDTPALFSIYTTIPLVILVAGIIILAVRGIFMYKNRLKQLKLIKVNILINIILIIGVFIVYSRWLQSTLSASESFKTAAFFPLISLLFLILSYYAVYKDEKLVRSADRLR